SGAYLQSAFIRNITTAKITFLDGSVQESAMATNAVAERKFDASVSTVTLSGTLVNIASVTIGKNTADYIEVDAVVRIESQPKLNDNQAEVEVRLREGTTEVDTQILKFPAPGELQVARLKFMVDSGNGNRTYSVIARVNAGAAIIGRRSLAAKRDKKSNA
ncbi:hypothetical protein, partial [Rhizobium sp. Root483D2]|uniref:hypothetical protein n=1 Tax=Rhizobium sp. Root483D2 TaxID=1736545 RepID=UPI0007159E33